jgi:hypothetical protein
MALPPRSEGRLSHGPAHPIFSSHNGYEEGRGRSALNWERTDTDNSSDSGTHHDSARAD